jgi:hypothetical protein
MLWLLRVEQLQAPRQDPGSVSTADNCLTQSLARCIWHAQALLDPAEPPTAAQFCDRYSTVPTPDFHAQPQPKQAHRAAEVRRKYLRPMAPKAGREVWVADMAKQ